MSLRVAKLLCGTEINDVELIATGSIGFSTNANLVEPVGDGVCHVLELGVETMKIGCVSIIHAR